MQQAVVASRTGLRAPQGPALGRPARRPRAVPLSPARCSAGDVEGTSAEQTGARFPRRAALAAILSSPALALLAPTAARAASRGPPTPGDLIELASFEPDPEIAVEVWDDAVALGGGAPALLGRAGVRLLLGRWEEAAVDYRAAADLFIAAAESGWAGGAGGSGKDEPRLSLPPDQGGRTVPLSAVQASLSLDGLGLAEGQLGNTEGARAAFNRSMGVLGQAGAGSVAVPEGTPYSGLRGGAATVGQRVALHAAMAQLADGDVDGAVNATVGQRVVVHAAMAQLADGDADGAVNALERIDKGPDPDGYPQFWDARAAQAVALSAAGARPRAEAVWGALCKPAPVPPPSVPTNPLFAGVNRLSSAFGETTGKLISSDCEDYDTGVYLPCDDAGIPGLGGSSAPCTLYSAGEARARLWPEPMIIALDNFIRGRK